LFRSEFGTLLVKLSCLPGNRGLTSVAWQTLVEGLFTQVDPNF